MTMRTAVTCAVALLALCAGPGAGQTSLPDRSTLVVTAQGLFFVPPGAAGSVNHVPDALRVASPADFGLLGPGAGGDLLSAPAVAWIDHTDVAFVSTGSHPDGPGRLFRVVLDARGRVTSIEEIATGPFEDVEYSPGLDTLYVLDRQGGRVLSLFDPAGAAPGALAVFSVQLAPGEAIDLAVDAHTWPFALSVLSEDGFHRVRESGALPQLEWINPGGWDGVERPPLGTDAYVLSRAAATFGLMVVNPITKVVSGAVDANLCGPVDPLSGPCVPLANPQDVVADDRTDPGQVRGLVVIGDTPAGGGCCFAGATGANHVVRFPILTAIASGNGPTLLTPTPVSGIVGARADLDHVRVHARGLTHQGWAQLTADGAHRVEAEASVNDGVQGDVLAVRLVGAPPDAAAMLLVHVLPPGHPEPVAALGLDDGPRVLPFVTDADGEAGIVFPLPSGGAREGTRAVFQWLVADRSASSGELRSVATQRVVYHHGTP